MSHLSRRDALRLMAAGVAGTVLLPSLTRAMSSAGSLNVAAKIDRIGVQLYTVRRAMAKDVDGTIAALAAAGIQEVEFAGYYNRTPQQWKVLLKAHGLTAPSTHIGFPKTNELWQPQFDIANGIGHQWIIVPSVDNDLRGSTEGYKRLADRLNQSGVLAKAAGLRNGYHNHEYEFETVGSSTGYDVLMGAIDPSLVDMEIDLFWAIKAGQDPRAMIARWPGRFPLCHVKDGGPPPERKMMDVGAGVVDFKSIFSKSRQAGFKHYFIEHDEPVDGVASAAASAAYLRKLTF